jgi:hypothetical protein
MPVYHVTLHIPSVNNDLRLLVISNLETTCYYGLWMYRYSAFDLQSTVGSIVFVFRLL